MTKNILLVTDDTHALAVLQTSVAGKALRVMHTNSIQQSVILFRQTIPDLFILDLTMQDKQAPALLREVRKHFPRLPVLVIVAAPDSNLIKEALKIGANRYITKVFLANMLTRTVSEMIKLDSIE